MKHSTNSIEGHGEGNTPSNQLQTIFFYLRENIATASMVADATGIYQKNICRYKRDMQKAGQLWEVEKKLCKKTGFKAWYLTTDPDKHQKAITLKTLKDATTDTMGI